MKFTKMHGLGNDYVYVNCFMEKVRDPALAARYVSDRHRGIGSDGLILIGPSEKADFRMQIYNADGSVAEMCGNGIRCLGKYVYEQGLTDKTKITVETLAGIRKMVLKVEEKKVIQVEVDMGIPILKADRIPVISEHTMVIDEPITVNGKEYRMTGVSMGNPHAVFYVRNVKRIDINWLGPCFEHHGRFPRRIHVEFTEVKDRHTLCVRVWERGAGETLSCGTGACAAVVASVLNNLTERKVSVKLKGGDLTVEWREDDNTVYMTGPAESVFDGEIYIPSEDEKSLR